MPDVVDEDELEKDYAQKDTRGVEYFLNFGIG